MPLDYISSPDQVIDNVQEFYRSRILPVTRAEVEREINEQFDPMYRWLLDRLPMIMERVTDIIFREYTSRRAGEHSVDSAYLSGEPESIDDPVNVPPALSTEDGSTVLEFENFVDWQCEVVDWDEAPFPSSSDWAPQTFPGPDFEQANWTYRDATSSVFSVDQLVQEAVNFEGRSLPQLQRDDYASFRTNSSNFRSSSEHEPLLEPPTTGMTHLDIFLGDLAGKLADELSSSEPRLQPRAGC